MKKQRPPPIKVWVLNTRTGKKGLFKPDSGNTPVPESSAEYRCSQIAKAIDVHCVDTEIIASDEIDRKTVNVEKFNISGLTVKDKNGIVSYDFKTIDSASYSQAEETFNNKGLGTLTELNNSGSARQRIGDMDIKTIIAEFPQLKQAIIEMAYFDCLINNSDRNTTNRHLERDETGNVTGIAKLFDHAVALENGNSNNVSRLYWEKPIGKYKDDTVTHYTVFKELCRHYPEEMKALLNRIEALEANSKLDAFCKPRIIEMKQRYLETQNERITKRFGRDSQTSLLNQPTNEGKHVPDDYQIGN
jgi:hypothetical protein